MICHSLFALLLLTSTTGMCTDSLSTYLHKADQLSHPEKSSYVDKLKPAGVTLTGQGCTVLAAVGLYGKEKKISEKQLKRHAWYSLRKNEPCLYDAKNTTFPKVTTCLDGHNQGVWLWNGNPKEEYYTSRQALDKLLADAASTKKSKSSDQASDASDKPTRTSILKPFGLTISAAGFIWFLSQFRRQRDRMLLKKAWQRLISAEHRAHLENTTTPFDQELIKSHGREAAAALALTIGGLAIAAYGAKKS
jgi:hypothetical protein